MTGRPGSTISAINAPTPQRIEIHFSHVPEELSKFAGHLPQMYSISYWGTRTYILPR